MTAHLSALRRCCMNPNRASYEMMLAWRAGGPSRCELLQRWMTHHDVAEVTAEIVLKDIQSKSRTHCLVCVRICVSRAQVGGNENGVA